MQPLHQLQSSIESKKRSSRFMILWTMMGDKEFAQSTQKTLAIDVVRRHLKEMDDMEMLVATTQSRIDTTMEAHMVMSKTAK